MSSTTANAGPGQAEPVLLDPLADGTPVPAGPVGDNPVRHGPVEAGHTHESACLNCGTRLIGSHCHACGQHAHVHRTLAAFFHDLAHGVFHVEGKVWRTLPMLAWRPGRLTREYIDGRRSSYVSPIALFLFAVFLMFTVMHLNEGSGGDTEILSSPKAALAIEQATLARLRQQRAAAKTPQEAATIDRRIAAAEHTVTRIGIISIDASSSDAAKSDAELRRTAPFVARAVATFRANPEFAIYKIQSTAYKYSWLLIPMSVPLVWLLFPFSRRFHLYDHTVFVTYSLTFMTLLEVASMLLDLIGVPLSGLLIVLIPVHMYRQLRGTYALSVIGTLWRTAALFAFAAITLTLFMVLLLTVELGS